MMPPGFAHASALPPETLREMKWLLAHNTLEVCKEETGGADARTRTMEANRSMFSFCNLYTNYLATKREKGMSLPGNVPCVHLMHIFKLLNRWKPNSLVAGENL